MLVQALVSCLFFFSYVHSFRYFGIQLNQPRQIVKARRNVLFHALPRMKSHEDDAANSISIASSPTDQSAASTTTKIEDYSFQISGTATTDSTTVTKYNETIHATYNFAHLGLPKLADVKNYFSGQYKDNFWQQNANEVLIFIPVDKSISKVDVNITFDVFEVLVQIAGQDTMKLPLPERTIPLGCYWLFENDVNGQKYIQICLEKRYRMINWKSVFLPKKVQSVEELQNEKNALLRQFYEANVGKFVCLSMVADL